MASYMVMDQCINALFANDRPDFNRDPFELGSFDNIVYTDNKKGATKDEFGIGISFNNESPLKGNHTELNISFKKSNALPQVHNLHYRYSENDFVALEKADGGTIITIPEFSVMSKLSLHDTNYFVELIANEIAAFPERHTHNIKALVSRRMIGHDTTNSQKEVNKIAAYFQRIVSKYVKHRTSGTQYVSNESSVMTPNIREAIAMAPLRSKPKRTYDPIRELPNPEGDHIPMLIMRLSKTNRQYWNKFRQSLIEFGKAAELFSDIRIESYGDEDSSPFQVQVKVRSGRFTNFMDVGYGVSQCLPVITNILYHCFNGSVGNSVFLLQQPEVHMHPRAQAELSNLVCNAYKVSGNQFMIETHSDFIVDRVRWLVRQGVVNEQDVSIIYFEPSGSSTKLHNIELDEDGNLVSCPDSYRRFFSNEIDRLVGIGD